jgi:hypothetical protein
MRKTFRSSPRHHPVVARLILVLIPVLGSAQTTAKKADVTLYFRNSDEQWCAYTSESTLRKELEAGETVGTVEFNGTRISRVRVTTPDDPGAGDWMMFDVYTVDASGNLRSLERTINVLPGNISQLETWLIDRGKAVKKSSLVRDLDTLKPKQGEADWVPDVQILTKLASLPVWPLVRDGGKSMATTGKACFTVKRPPLTPPPPPVPVKSWATYVDDRFGWSVEYPSTWTAYSSCPAGCPAPGEAVIFTDPSTGNAVIIDSLTDPLAGRSIEARLQDLKKTNVNPQVSESEIRLGNLKALTVRYEQPETQMESTYVVTDSAHFGITFSSIHWKIEQMTDYPAYRHMLESFKFSK